MVAISSIDHDIYKCFSLARFNERILAPPPSLTFIDLFYFIQFLKNSFTFFDWSIFLLSGTQMRNQLSFSK